MPTKLFSGWKSLIATQKYLLVDMLTLTSDIALDNKDWMVGVFTDHPGAHSLMYFRYYIDIYVSGSLVDVLGQPMDKIHK